MASILKFFLLLACCTFAAAAGAQQLDTLQLYKHGEPLPPLIGLRANSGAEFKQISLRESSFPVLILPAEPVHAAFDKFKAVDGLVNSLEEENHALAIQDTLSMLATTKLRNIIDIKDRNIQLSEATIASLNKSIGDLNNQLDRTRQLAEDCNKARGAKSMWGVILGGGIGFGIGAILGILVAK